MARIAAVEIAAMLQSVKEEIPWICSEKTTRVRLGFVRATEEEEEETEERKEKKEEEEDEGGEHDRGSRG